MLRSLAKEFIAKRAYEAVMGYRCFQSGPGAAYQAWDWAPSDDKGRFRQLVETVDTSTPPPSAPELGLHGQQEVTELFIADHTVRTWLRTFKKFRLA